MSSFKRNIRVTLCKIPLLNWAYNHYRTFIKEYRIFRPWIKTIIRNYVYNEVVIIPFYSIGDFIYGTCYIPELNRKNPYKKILLYAPCEKKDLVSTLQGTFIPYYYNRNSGFFTNAISPLFYDAKHIIKLSNFKIYVTYGWSLNDDGNATLNIRNILGLNNDSKVSFPIVNIDTSHKDEKIAILNPYSISSIEIAMDIWEKIAVLLKKKGYNVYTNVIKDQIAIKDTERLDCQLIELYQLLNDKNKVFISIRSGIVDFTFSSMAKKVILTTDFAEPKKTAKFVNYYDVERTWGHKYNHLNIRCKKSNERDIVHDVDLFIN